MIMPIMMMMMMIVTRIIYAQVSPRNVLISPVKCKSIWRQFKVETEYTISQAMSALVHCLFLHFIFDDHPNLFLKIEVLDPIRLYQTLID